MIDDKAADLGKLLTLEQEVRQADPCERTGGARRTEAARAPKAGCPLHGGGGGGVHAQPILARLGRHGEQPDSGSAQDAWQLQSFVG